MLFIIRDTGDTALLHLCLGSAQVYPTYNRLHKLGPTHHTEIPELKQYNWFHSVPSWTQTLFFKASTPRRSQEDFVSEDTEIEIGLLVWRETKDEHQFAEESVSASGGNRSRPCFTKPLVPPYTHAMCSHSSAPDVHGLGSAWKPYPQCQSQPLQLSAKLSTPSKTINS